MKKYKNSIIIFTVTLTILFLSELFTERTIEKYRKGTVGKINAVVDHKLDAEITIWGASTAYVNINPKIIQDSLKMTTMNMGIDGTNIDQFYGLLNEFLNYTQKSKFLIIAIDAPGGICNRKYIYNLHNWIHHLDNENIYESLKDIDSSLIVKSKYVPFYKMTMYNKHSFSYFRKSLFNQENKYSFPELGFENTKKAIINSITLTPRRVEIGLRAFKKLKDVCDLAVKRNIRPIIVITPCYVKGQEYIINYDKITEKVQSISNKKISVFDFSKDSFSFEQKHFLDFTHLNLQGSKSFSSKLAQSLIEAGL